LVKQLDYGYYACEKDWAVGTPPLAPWGMEMGLTMYIHGSISPSPLVRFCVLLFMFIS